MADLIKLEGEALQIFVAEARDATERGRPLRLWIDSLDPSGIKVKVGEGIWSLPLGTLEVRP